ncbi:NADH-flavin reductase [Agromyces luteolus]|uniref:NAD(P)H-binding protein n=1 Tax=Agromyces luteolus TaxID=88373 RepID=A0A7C9HJM5_9MICO|nr:NAD(P)-binding oxidoreductase [Agromyces luteolus]MUN08581.1 NAD(P)H-binding protein [Agromyces luteolus]GLK27118.1 NADH-flavin reductase [Agromyces luteolus]
MRIAVLGATGRTGGEVVRQALAAGHEVVAYVRRPEAMNAAAGLTIVGGQLEDGAALVRALAGCDAVVITLGPKVTQPNVPIMQTAVPAVIAAARTTGVDRVVVLSALGAGNTFANTRYPYRFGCRTFLAGNFRDHVAGESQLVGSGLKWTTFHPGPLFDAARTPHPTIVDAATGYRMPGAPRTQRADVAAAILDAIDDPDTYGKEMLITSARQAA